MVLDFITTDGVDEGRLLRFYEWADGEVALLREAAERLAAGASRSIEVHRLPFINAVGGITFTWVVDPWDRGVLMPDDQRSFVMQLPQETWTDIVKIIWTEARDPHAGYSWWLKVTQVQVLLSWGGTW